MRHKLNHSVPIIELNKMYGNFFKLKEPSLKVVYIEGQIFECGKFAATFKRRRA